MRMYWAVKWEFRLRGSCTSRVPAVWLWGPTHHLRLRDRRSSWSDFRTGWTGGGGIEYLIVPNVTLRVEYRYTDFGYYEKYVPLSTPQLRVRRFHVDRLRPPHQAMRRSICIRPSVRSARGVAFNL
jgi:hypothetical protein